MFDEKFDDVKGLSISDKYVLLRELSPNNFKYIEAWNMWCAMSHNLAIAAALVFINSMVKAVFFQTGNGAFWLLFGLSFLILFFLFLQRAVKFYVWGASDINSSIAKLHLEARANQLLETDKTKTA